ncbi:MAG: ankyrin repeat domain-containing protein, partial [Verrucomicrobiae bacterium]|nr:ankyrin repeat domain-containing protein [Verrucomicrobiae bacterium]
QRLLVEAGRAEAGTVLTLERELLALERRMAGAGEKPALAATADSGLSPATSEEAEEIRRIQALVANSPDLINAQPEGQTTTPLMNAALKGQLVVARYLLEHGARVDQASSDDDSRTALSLAVDAGHRTMAELLIGRGATVAPEVAQTPLHLAALRGFVSLAELLVSEGADVNYQWDSGHGKSVTPLWRAAQYNHEAMARFLLEHGADPNLAGKGVLPNPEPSTPLTVASSASMVQLLLKHGADPNADNSARLMKAIRYRQIDVLRVLLDAGAKVNVQAVALGNRKDGTPGPLTSSAEGLRSPLAFAISLGWMEGARLLRDHGADVNLAAADSRGVQWTPLHFAASNSNLEEIRWLLAEGAKADIRDALDRTALVIVMEAAWARSRGLIPARTPVPGVEAPERNDPWDVVLALVNAGADLKTILNGFSVIHYAVAVGRIDVLEALKEHGADLNARGDHRVTPLMVAVGMDEPETLDWLLKNGADANLQDGDGNTALHVAARTLSLTLTERLLKAGASPTVVNALGQTPAGFMDQNVQVDARGFGLPRLPRDRWGELQPAQANGHWLDGSALLPSPGNPLNTPRMEQLLAPDSPTPPEPDKDQSP